MTTEEDLRKPSNIAILEDYLQQNKTLNCRVDKSNCSKSKKKHENNNNSVTTPKYTWASKKNY